MPCGAQRLSACRLVFAAPLRDVKRAKVRDRPRETRRPGRRLYSPRQSPFRGRAAHEQMASQVAGEPGLRVSKRLQSLLARAAHAAYDQALDGGFLLRL